MDKLPSNVIRFDVLKVEYGKEKMCKCVSPHYEIDYQNHLVYCQDCGAIVDPFEALVHIARDFKRIDDHTEIMLEQRRQIEKYHPRRLVIKKLEEQYISSRKNNLEPSCPYCGRVFPLEKLLETSWCNPAFCGGNSEI